MNTTKTTTKTRDKTRTGLARLLALTLTLTLALAFIATAHTALAAGTLRIGNDGEPESMDPHFTTTVQTSRILEDQFLGLTTPSAKGEAVPGAATSWNISSDGLTYTFNIRSHNWSDGVPVSAHDFVYAWKRILDPEIGATYASLLYIVDGAEDYNTGKAGADIVGVRAVSDSVLEVRLKAPAPYFLEQLTHQTAMPLPQHVVSKFPRTSQEWSKPENIQVNGPYKLASWTPNVEVRLKKNPGFYDAGNVFFDEVIFYSIEDRTTMVKRFRAGEIDIARDLPSEQIDLLRKEVGESVKIAPYNGIYYYAFNAKEAPMNSRDVRVALSMAIDREAVTDKVLRTGEVPAYSFVPPGSGNYGEPAWVTWRNTPYKERVATAKGLLENAGYSADKPLKVVLRYNTSENHKRVAIAIAAMWKQLGVETELFNTDGVTHYDDLQNGDFQIGRAGWISDYNDAQNFLYLLEKRTGAFNYGRYDNSAFNKLMLEAEVTTDLDKRAEIMHQAETLAMADQPIAPIYYYVSKALVSPKVKNWHDNGPDKHNTRWLSF